MEVTFGDFLAGGGGVTTAAYNMPDVKVKWVLNHSGVAIRTNIFHHKNVKHYWADLYKQNEREMSFVDIAWASIECTQHSRANGGRMKKIGSYTLGWEFVRYIKYLRPYYLVIENVPEFIKWAPIYSNGLPNKNKIGAEFLRWKQSIEALGYTYEHRIFNAADFGIPTRRVRYFAVFARIGLKISWPEPTHHQNGVEGENRWVACKNYIDLSDEGNSIFGRKFNPDIRKNKRRPLSPNTLRRIAGGIKKYAPDMFYVMKYHGNGHNCQSINAPLNCIATTEQQVLIKVEKKSFIQDYCYNDNYNSVDEPLRPQLTRQTKQFISIQYNSNGRPEFNNKSLQDPLNALTTDEKFQFITTHFDIDNIDKKKLVDFDIKMRFLQPDELSAITTFPGNYFTDKRLKLTKKEQIKLIGNAVPPTMAKLIIEPLVENLKKFKRDESKRNLSILRQHIQRSRQTHKNLPATQRGARTGRQRLSPVHVRCSIPERFRRKFSRN